MFLLSLPSTSGIPRPLFWVQGGQLDQDRMRILACLTTSTLPPLPIRSTLTRKLDFPEIKYNVSYMAVITAIYTPISSDFFPSGTTTDYADLTLGLVLNRISFHYYPLDVTPTSNPFLLSWWPLALGDPALFHVSLQTAALDAELMAQKGFHTSEILMADSVSLLRRKVQDPILAIQDATMNSVVTLAAIEVNPVPSEASLAATLTISCLYMV